MVARGEPNMGWLRPQPPTPGQIAPGEVLEVSRGVECRIERYPLGVVAAITPFNFPNMVPNWSIPNAIALGNCMILKPSELVPLMRRAFAHGLLPAVHAIGDQANTIALDAFEEVGCPAQRVDDHAGLLQVFDEVLPGLATLNEPLLLEVVVEPDEVFAP